MSDRSPFRPPCIMLVEDDPDVEHLIRRVLRNFFPDVRLTVGADGAEAIEMLKDESFKPSFVLLDISIPKLDGFQVLEWIREQERFADTPVVMFSSSDEAKDIEEGAAKGANSYICKPVEYEEFIRVLDSVIRYWMNLNKGPFLRRRG